MGTSKIIYSMPEEDGCCCVIFSYPTFSDVNFNLFLTKKKTFDMPMKMLIMFRYILHNYWP